VLCVADRRRAEPEPSPYRGTAGQGRSDKRTVARIAPVALEFGPMQAAAVARIAPTAIGYWPAAAGTSERSMLRRPASGTF
jgi:hypothetical protein